MEKEKLIILAIVIVAIIVLLYLSGVINLGSSDEKPLTEAPPFDLRAYLESNGPFYISNVKHRDWVVQAKNPTNNTVALRPRTEEGDPQSSLKWNFSSASETTYYIFDSDSNLAMLAGDEADNDIYHQLHESRLNAQWELVPVESVDNPSITDKFYIIDKKHGKALLAGDENDGKVFHQPHNNRANAQWYIQKA